MPRPGQGGPADHTANTANSAVTANDAAEFAAFAKSRGVPEDQINQSLAKVGFDPAASGATPTPRKDPLAEPMAPGSIYSKGDVQSFAEDMLAAGHDREYVEEFLEKQGLQVDLTYEPDPRGGRAIEHDDQWTPPEVGGIRPIKPIMPAGTTEADYAAAVTDGRAFVHQVGFENDIGASVVEEVYDVMAKISRMTDADRAQWQQSQQELVIRTVGEANLQKTLDDAARALGNAKTGKFWTKCVATGANFSADLLLQLAGRGARMTIRKGL